MPPESTISLRLPEGKSVDVYLVRLVDGRIVSRTREELEEGIAILDDVLSIADEYYAD